MSVLPFKLFRYLSLFTEHSHSSCVLLPFPALLLLVTFSLSLTIYLSIYLSISVTLSLSTSNLLLFLSQFNTSFSSPFSVLVFVIIFFFSNRYKSIVEIIFHSPYFPLIHCLLAVIISFFLLFLSCAFFF